MEAKAKAEAEQMAKKADAWKEYKEAAMVRLTASMFYFKGLYNLRGILLVRFYDDEARKDQSLCLDFD